MLVKIFALIGGITFILVDLLDKKSRKELSPFPKNWALWQKIPVACIAYVLGLSFTALQFACYGFLAGLLLNGLGWVLDQHIHVSSTFVIVVVIAILVAAMPAALVSSTVNAEEAFLKTQNNGGSIP